MHCTEFNPPNSLYLGFKYSNRKITPSRCYGRLKDGLFFKGFARGRVEFCGCCLSISPIQLKSNFVVETSEGFID